MARPDDPVLFARGGRSAPPLSRRRLLGRAAALGLTAPNLSGLLLGRTGHAAAASGLLGAPAWLQDQGKPGGSIQVGIGVDALTFDPHNSKATTDLQIDNLVYDTLVGANPDTFDLTPASPRSGRRPTTRCGG